MKLVLLALSLVASAQAQNYNYSAVCDSATKSNDCPTVSGCIWEKNSLGNWYCHDGHDYVNCVNRTATDCEDDDSCFLTNNKGTKTCTEVNLGSGTQGDWCQSYYLNDTDGGVYLEVAGYGCAEGYICSVGNETGSAPGVPINGTCASTTCLGKKVPGNCGTSNGPNDQCNQTTERVTICHRTCSEKNPWVRITIDDDAWDGDGCGHMREHHVEIDCKNKAPWTAWGPNRSDYLIKFHGSRDHVRTINNFNMAEEKAYWRYWEPACPYVRQDKCCDWSLGSCCGAKTLPTYTPLVQVEKYAGPSGQCAAGNMADMQDVLYTLPTWNASWSYCYVVTVPQGSECLYNMEMSDSAPIGGIGSGYVLTNYTSKRDYTSLMEAETMCPGDVKYVPGPTIYNGIEKPEEGYDACVVGTGIMSGNDVSACNPAGVEPPLCSLNMGVTEGNLCPGNVDAVSTLEVKAMNNVIIPAGYDPSGMFYNMSIGGVAGVAAEITFKLDSPFEFPADMFVQYHKKAVGSSKGALDPSCDAKLQEPGCNEQATTITAGCIHPVNEPAFALVSVFFISTESLFGSGAADAVPYECCPIPTADQGKPIIEYVFKVLCECPSGSSSRQLTEKDWIQMWQQEVGTGH